MHAADRHAPFCLPLAGAPYDGNNDFARKVQALPTLIERLDLLARGQIGVVKRLDTVVQAVTESDARKEPVEMRQEHVDNVKWRNDQVAELKQMET